MKASTFSGDFLLHQMTTWKVSHRLLPPVAYESGPNIYPSLGVTLVLEGSEISQVDHQFTADDALSEAAVTELSTQELALVWEIINYRWGYPAPVAHRIVERRGTASETSLSCTHFATQTARSAIVHRIRLPDEARLLSAHDRLHAWLRLANDARRPTSPSDAIRNYYMVWEDMQGRPGPAAVGSAGEELKFIRDFVSHGEELGSAPLLEFLRREFGKETKRYDPHDPDHRSFLEQRREWAMRLVESEIDKHL